MIGWFKEGISNERLDIIFNPSHFLVFNYILDDMILKRKKIVIQWRKFGLKSCIFKVMNFWSLCPFSDFYLIFLNFIKCILSLKKLQKVGFYPQDRGADVACRGAQGWLTWHAGPAQMRRGTQGHVAEPREPTWGTGGAQGVDTWQEAMWVHADAREGRHVARGAGVWRAHGLVGPSESIGAVTQMRYRALPFIRADFPVFLRVGLITCIYNSNS